MTSRVRKISLKFFEKMSIFNRIYRANIVTSGPRSTSKACFVKNFQSHFLRQLRDLQHSHHTVLEDCMFQSLPPHQYRDKSVLPAIACKARLSLHCDAFKASDRRHHAVEFIRNPVSSYFHSQVFYFYAIVFTRTAMNRYFRSQVRLSCDGKLTRNRANSDFQEGVCVSQGRPVGLHAHVALVSKVPGKCFIGRNAVLLPQVDFFIVVGLLFVQRNCYKLALPTRKCVKIFNKKAQKCQILPSETIKTCQKIHNWGAKVQNFSGEGPPSLAGFTCFFAGCGEPWDVVRDCFDDRSRYACCLQVGRESLPLRNANMCELANWDVHATVLHGGGVEFGAYGLSWTRLSTHTRTVSQQVHPPMHACAPFFLSLRPSMKRPVKLNKHVAHFHFHVCK